jgi:hypothetical protein
MVFFEGFKWAVPKAYLDALSTCRFEQGDILYADRISYTESWKAVQTGQFDVIQVLHPGKSRGAAGDNDEQIFLRNWDSTVQIDLYKGSKRVNALPISMTQGRLYTLLWTGAVAMLDANSKQPKVPKLARDLKKELEKKIESIAEFASNGSFFAMLHDECNPTLAAKHLKLGAAFAKCTGGYIKQISLSECKFPNWTEVLPTVSVSLFGASKLDAEATRLLVKNCVYKRTIASSKDQFSLAPHGVIGNK